jgi:hypothetical protein
MHSIEIERVVGPPDILLVGSSGTVAGKFMIPWSEMNRRHQRRNEIAVFLPLLRKLDRIIAESFDHVPHGHDEVGTKASDFFDNLLIHP